MNRQSLRLFSAAAVAALFALLQVQAQAKPNFSGSWKLNVNKSDFGPMPAPDSRSDTITQADPEIKDSFTQSGQMGEITADVKYLTDGTETTNTLRGNEIKSVAKWEGDELVVASKTSFNGAGVTFNDRWTLSADGKTLTIQRHAISPMGEADQKIVLEKQ